MLTSRELFKRRTRRTRHALRSKTKRPRLSVFRSSKHIYVQVIDDANGVTLAAASTLEKELKGKLKTGADREAAVEVGKLIAQRAKASGVEEVVFDRGGYLFHGRVKALADAAREAGLKFYAVVEGPDFRFGRDRSGSIQALHEYGCSAGFTTIVVDPVDVALSDQSIARASSSIVRWLLQHGRVRDAHLVLGRPYELRATVTRGDQQGRRIGVPTANLDTGDMLLPADGIYAGCATAPNGAPHVAAISVGTKPTFGSHPRTCEVHLVDYTGPVDTYGWPIQVRFHEWIRDQLIYSTTDELTAQIARDIALTRRLMARSGTVHEASDAT